jgi:peptidoglycan hydrolase FlgJ
MNISAITSQRPLDASNIPVQDLANNKNLTEDQKIAEASRQFEAIMLRQILSESQKPVITSEFTDNSTAAGIYQDLITNSLADSMSKSGTLGLTKIFEQQLTHHTPKTGAVAKATVSAVPQKTAANFEPEFSVQPNKPPFSTVHHE